jgi:biotin carboxylase
VLVKADVGGSGAGISRYDTPEELAQAAADRTAPMGVNGIALVQEYAPRRDGRITRIEVLDGKMLYAIHVESPGESFDLCPADFCMIQPGKAKITMTRTQPPAEAVAAAEAIVKAGGFDIAGVEYLVDDRDGEMLFYDINGLSNFVADPTNILGYDPHETLVDYLEGQIARRKEAA